MGTTAGMYVPTFKLVAGSNLLSQFGIAGTNYCGPGYTNGKLSNEAADHDGIWTGPIDKACWEHDLAYGELANSLTPAADRLAADQKLLADIAALFQSGALSRDDMAIAVAVLAAFEKKVSLYDTPAAVTEAAKGLIGGLLDKLGVSGISFDVDFTPLSPAIGVVVNTLFGSSRSAILRRDPLALDLDGDGLETVGIGAAPVLFDHDGDGVRSGTGWLRGDDAFLALDRNGNGTIDNGGELFGVDTVLANGQKATNGFAALADLDSNHDGKFSSLDAQFANVKVWRDLNQDGISQSDELQSLAAAGIASINLASSATNVALGNGNVQSAAGSFTKTNGQIGSVGEFTTGTSGNLDLAQNPFYSEFTTPIALTEAARSLPGMHGSGMVRDLQEAASLSPALLADVSGLTGTTRAQMQSRIDTLLADWANTSTMKTSMADAASRNFALVYLPVGMSVIDYLTLQSGTLFLAPAAEQARLRALEVQQQQYTNLIGILERFNGLPFVTVTDNAVTTGQGQMVAAAAPTGGPTGAVLPGAKYAFVSLNAMQTPLLDQSYAQLKESVYGGLVMQIRLKAYMDAISLTIDETGIRLDFAAMEAAMDALHTGNAGKALADRVDLMKYAGPSLQGSGWEGVGKIDQWISAAEADGSWGSLLASLGTDFTGAGTEGDDIHLMATVSTAFYGGSGNDVVIGASGADKIDGGVGDDVIDGGDGNDTITGGDGNDVIDGGDGNDTITDNKGTNTLEGGLGNDTITGGAGNDVIDGGDGNDTITDNKGTNTLKGGLGNDTLTGRGSFEGGKGDDTLSGSDFYSGDTYVFNLGDGKDTVIEYGGSNAIGYGGAGLDDTLKFGAGILPSAVSLVRSGDDLSFQVSATDQVTVKNWFADGGYRYIEQVQFANGTVWRASGLFTGTAGNDTITGTAGNDAICGATGDDTLYGGTGNDILNGGAGADALIGGLGDDTYVVDNAGDVVAENLNEGTDLVQSSVTHFLAVNVENLTLTGATAINGTGNTLSNAITGNSAINTLSGGDGNDTLNGGAGADALIGGLGDDIYVVDNAGDVVTESLNEGTDLVQSSVTYTLGANLENLTLAGTSAINGTGNTANNLVIGNGAANILNGADGNDTLIGGFGSDILQGGLGNDVLEGDPVGSAESVALTTLVINARGTPFDNVFPTMEVWIDGVRIQVITVDALSYTAYTVSVPAGTLAKEVAVVFTNDAYDALTRQDRNLYIDQIVVNGHPIKGNASGVLVDYGGGSAAFDDVNTYAAASALGSVGAMRFRLLGADLLDGGSGADTLRGGIGNDVYLVDNLADRIEEGVNAGHDQVRSSVSYVLADNVEDLTLTGTANLDGTGNSAMNMVVGNSGDNRLDGGLGRDFLVGGMGDDRFVVDDVGDITREAVDAGSDTVESSISWTLQANTEALLLSGTAAINGNGNALHNLVRGNTGNNTLTGGSGNDVLEGGAGDDRLTDASGTALLNGGLGIDTLTGGAAAELYIGGLGNDTTTTSGGNDIIAFNKGDGQDTFAAGGTGSDTLSLGGNFAYTDLSFTKVANDLVLRVGASDQIAFKNWYAATPSKPVVNLQVIAEAMAGFNAGGADPLLDQKVENFNFSALVGAFDTARSANPALTTWALTNALANFQLAGSDSAAIGGDLAYQYGKNGTLAGIGLSAAQDVIGSASFGSQAQTLQPLVALQTGAIRLG